MLSVVLLVVIGIVDAFHEHVAVIDFGGESRLYQLFYMRTVADALAHCSEVFVLINLTPVHTEFQRALEHEVKPNACASSIAFHKRMCYVHFNVFIHDFVKGRFRHTLNHLERTWEMEAVGKCKASFRYVLCANLPGKIIKTAKYVGMNLLEAFQAAWFQPAQQTALVELIGFFTALPIEGVVAISEPVKKRCSTVVGVMLG